MSLHLCLLAHQLLAFQLQAAKGSQGFHSRTCISCPIPPVPIPGTSASSAHLLPAPAGSGGSRGVTHPPWGTCTPRLCCAHTCSTHPELRPLPAPTPRSAKGNAADLPLGTPAQDLAPQLTVSRCPSAQTPFPFLSRRSLHQAPFLHLLLPRFPRCSSAPASLVPSPLCPRRSLRPQPSPTPITPRPTCGTAPAGTEIPP